MGRYEDRIAARSTRQTGATTGNNANASSTTGFYERRLEQRKNDLESKSAAKMSSWKETTPSGLRYEAESIKKKADALRSEAAKKAASAASMYSTMGIGGAAAWAEDLYDEETEKQLAEYDRQYERLMAQHYELENKYKKGSMNENGAASSLYSEAQTAEENIKKIWKTVLGRAGNTTGITNPRYLDYVTQEQAEDEAHLQSLQEKYGTEDPFALTGRIRAEGKDAEGQLEGMGYNYDRMADYARRQEQAQQRQQEQEQNTAYAQEHPVMASVGTVAAAPLQVVDFAKKGVETIQQSLRGEEDWRPVSSDDMEITNLVTDIRGQVSKDLEENTDWELFGQNVASFLYNTGMSMADSTVTIATAGPSASVLLGGSAASQTAKDVLDNGGSAAQATLSGLAAGAAEMIFEKFSVERLLKTTDVTSMKMLVKSALKQAGTEASEEMLTEVSNILSNAAIMGADSDFNQAVAYYMSTEGMTEQEAKKKALLDEVGQVLWAGAGGALSGGIMGSGAASANLYGNVQQMAAEYGENPAAVVRDVLKADPNNKTAQELQKAIDQGEEVSAYALTKLRGEAMGVVERQAKAAQKAAKKAERQAYRNDSTEKLTAKRTEALDAVVQKYGEQAEAVKTVYGLGENQDAAMFDAAFEQAYTMGKNNESYDYMMDSVATAYLTEEQRHQAYAIGQEAYDRANEGKAKSKTDGTALDITGIEQVADGVITYTLGDGSTITDADVAYASQADAQLSKTLRRTTMSGETATAVLTAYHERSGVTAEGFAANVERAYNYGKKGIALAELTDRYKNATKMPQDVLAAVYAEGRAVEQATVKQAQARTSGVEDRAAEGKRGSVQFMNGAETSDFHKYISQSGKKLNMQQEAAVQMMDRLAELLGVNFYVYESYKQGGRRVYSGRDGSVQTAPNGYYTMGTGEIAIDLNAGVGGKGLMLYTVSHELTHFIQSWSPAKYRILCDAVIAEYSRVGRSFSEMLEAQKQKAQRIGENTDFDTLFDEAIADSMEAIMTDGDMVELMDDLKGRDENLWKRVRNWLKNVVDQLKAIVDAYKGHKPDSAEGRFIQEAEGALERLQPIFVDALLDAGETYQATKNTAEDGGVSDVQYSIREEFADELDAWDGKSKKTFRVGTTSDVLKNIGVKDAGIIWHGGKIAKIMREHPAMTKDVIKQVPEILENPVIILASKNSDSRLVMFGTILDADGNPVTAILELQPTTKGGQVVNLNVIASAYGKKSTKNLVESSGLVYLDADKKRTKSWMQGVGLQLPSDANASGYIGRVTYSGEKVNIESVPYNRFVEIFQVTENTAEDGGVKYSERFLAADVNPDILAMVYKVQSGNFVSKDRVHLGKVDGDVADRIFALTGIPVHDYDVMIEARQIDHIIKDHGENGVTDHSMADPENIARMEYALRTPDDIRNAGKTFAYVSSAKGRNRRADTVLYEKQIGEKAYYVIQAVPETKNKTLYIVTAFIGESGYRKEALQSTDANGPDATPKAESANASVNSISDDQQEVKRSTRDADAEAAQEILDQQNALLEQGVSYLQRLVKLQGKTAIGKELDKKRLGTTARDLMEQVGAVGKHTELAALLREFYDYIAEGEDLSAGSVREAAQPVIDWLQEHIPQEGELDPMAQEILDIIKAQKIRFSEAQKQEAAYLSGGWGLYRNGVLGNIFITDKASVTLDEFWNDMARSYPTVFDGTISDTEQVTALEQVIYELQNMRQEPEYYDADLLAAELFDRAYEGFWEVTAEAELADRYEEQIREIRRKHSQQMTKARQLRKDAVQKLKDNQRKQREKIRQEEREKAEKDRKDLQAEYEQSRKTASENRQKTLERQKIRRNIQRLKRMMEQRQADRNVKEDLREFAQSTLDASEVLFVQHYSDEDMIRYGIGTELTEKEKKAVRAAKKVIEELDNFTPSDRSKYAQTFDEIWTLEDKKRQLLAELRDVFVRERARMNRVPVQSVMQGLIDSYAELRNSTDPVTASAFDAEVLDFMIDFRESIGGTTVKDMSLEQLQDLNDMYTMVLTRLRDANKLWCQDKNARAQETADAVRAELEVQPKQSKEQLPVVGRLKRFGWNNLKPVYAFERIGSGTLSKLYNKVRDGEDAWALDMKQARDKRLTLEEKYGADEWNMDERFSFTAASGDAFDLSLGQVMSVYAYWKREQAREHLTQGGVVVDESTVVKETKVGLKVTYEKADATAYNFSEDTVRSIIGTLTPDQVKFVDEMQDYLSRDMGAKGNEVSMKLYGIKLFKEEHYFPITSSDLYLAKKRERAGQQVKVKNSGFTKKVTPDANNPIVLMPFMEVWADHVNDMSMYHALTLPLEDFYKVYNYKMNSGETEKEISISALVQNAHGAGAVDYIDQFLKDVNGDVVSDNREQPAKRMVSKFKKAKVFTSASVIIQQPSAIGRAFAMVDPKYFATTKGVTNRKAQLAEMERYAPVTLIKQMGYFDTDMGMSARDYLLAKEYEGWDKVKGFLKDAQYRDEELGRLPALADELAWCTIWEAVKRETLAGDADLAYGSEEHLARSGERFTEVITRTQVYDSVFSRSANMRSKSTLMGMATAFMAEGTTTINMAEDAVRKGLAGDKKYCARTMGAVYASVLLNSILVSLVYAARDDDEDETYLEKYVSSLVTEVIDGINPATYIPFIKDAWSLAMGYDVERTDMSIIADLLTALNKMKDTLVKDTDDMTEEELDAHGKDIKSAVLDVLDEVTAVLGLSVGNVRRDLAAFFNLFKTANNGTHTTANTLGDAAFEGWLGAIPELMRPDSKTKTEMLLEAYMEGDQEMKSRLVKSYATEEKALSALKSAAKKAYQNGEITKQQAISVLQQHVGMRSEEAKELVEEWTCKVVTGIAYDEIQEAYLDGEITAQRAAEMQVKYGGVSDKKAQAAVTQWQCEKDTGIAYGDLKEAYLNGEITQEKAAQLRVKYGGVSASDAAETLEEWAFEKEWGYAYSDRVELYKAGEITEDEIRTILKEFGGCTDTEVNNYVKAYNWMKENPSYNLTVSEALAYTKTVDTLGVSAEDVGIHPDTFVEYRTMAAACKGVDSDGDGQADRNSKKEQILAVIDSLPISSYQKDVLYYMNGWAKSTLRKAPWR